jgi:hypothetical protein
MEEPKPENGASVGNVEGTAGSDAKVESGSAAAAGAPDLDAGVAWPPPEAAPAADGANVDAAKTESASEAAAEAKAPTPNDSGVMTAPEQPEAAKKAPGGDADMPAATPQEEMGLSNSTLHWLEDGDQSVPGHVTEPGTLPSYDPRAPVAGRKRSVLVVGGAGLVALVVAGWFYSQSVKRHAADTPAPVVVEPARDLTNRAEAALSANKVDEAMELAHLALVADGRFADAHFVVATCRQARNQQTEARDEFRKYLELAPLGAHAAAARTALATLPP